MGAHRRKATLTTPCSKRDFAFQVKSPTRAIARPAIGGPAPPRSPSSLREGRPGARAILAGLSAEVTKPDQVKTYHDQVGYWLWEPATGAVVHTLTIPRGQTAMAHGQASADATSFELKSQRGQETFGICSVPFLEYAFKTVAASR